MQTPAQRDRSDRMNQYLMEQTCAEIEAEQDARQLYEDTIAGNDTGMIDDDAEIAWLDAEDALAEARDRAWENMPTF